VQNFKSGRTQIYSVLHVSSWTPFKCILAVDLQQ